MSLSEALTAALAAKNIPPAPPVTPAPSKPKKEQPVTREWFNYLVRSGDGTVTIVITPEIAGWLLELNTDNRPLHRSGVEQYSAALKEGRQINTGEPVIVCSDGVLGDGQHRLNAIIATGISCKLDIRFGIDPAARDRMGIGLKRTVGDTLARDGHKNANMLAAIVTGLNSHIGGGATTSKKYVTPDVARAIISDHPWLPRLTNTLCQTQFPPIRKGWCGTCLAIYRLTNTEHHVHGFLQHVVRRVGGETNAAVLLNKRLVNMASSRAKSPLADRMIAFTHAWNAWAEDRPIKRLQGATYGENRTANYFPPIVICRRAL